ncbi:MAG: type II toxin-antitoxin system VapB family antitoxin [Hyphomonadaceae bacterium]
MSPNSKNPALEAEIRALAAETGEGLTEAIANAVAERRARVRVRKGGGRRNRRAALAKIVSSVKLPAEYRRSSHDELYDESGLPK